MVAYLDDVIAGEPEACLRAFWVVKEGAAELGLSVQQNKCKVLLPKSKSVSKVIHGKGFCFAGRGMPLLGTVVGPGSRAG